MPYMDDERKKPNKNMNIVTLKETLFEKNQSRTCPSDPMVSNALVVFGYRCKEDIPQRQFLGDRVALFDPDCFAKQQQQIQGRWLDLFRCAIGKAWGGRVIGAKIKRQF